MSALYFVLLFYHFIVLAHWNNIPLVDMSLHVDTLSWLRANQSSLLLLNFACLVMEIKIQKIKTQLSHYNVFTRFYWDSKRDSYCLWFDLTVAQTHEMFLCMHG